MKRVFFSFLCLMASVATLLFGPAAYAAGLTVDLKNTSGAPVAFAVVTWTPAAGAAIPAAEKSKAFIMMQKNVQFAPFVLAVPAGATVAFPNEDRVNHHVYSFSPAQPFQFPLYGKGKSRTMNFPHPGTVALGCNIHDSMSAYIRVVDTPYYATSDASGRVSLNVPEGAGTLTIWQPTLDAPDHQVSKTLSAGKAPVGLSFSLKVRALAPTAGQY
jgi:plastocyanin